MQAYIPNKSELDEAIQKAVHSSMRQIVPELVRKATRKEYLTKEELIELTGFSSRKIQMLRDARAIPFTQHGRKILYPYDGIIKYLESFKVKDVQL